MKTINSSNARKSFAGILELILTDDVPMVIVRYGKPIAAIVPLSRLSMADQAAVKCAIDTGGRIDRPRQRNP